MNRFEAHINKETCTVVEPHLCFKLCGIGNAAMLSPELCVPAIGEKHCRLVEIALFNRQTESFKDKCGNRNLLDPVIGSLKNTGFQHNFGIICMDFIHRFLITRQYFKIRSAHFPRSAGSADIFGSHILNQADILIDT